MTAYRPRMLVVGNDALAIEQLRTAFAAARTVGSEFLQKLPLDEAVRLAAADQADLLFLDLSLSGWTGLGALARTRAAAVDVPVVILVSGADAGLAAECARLGAEAVLVIADLSGPLLDQTLAAVFRRRRDARRLVQETRQAMLGTFPGPALLVDRFGMILNVNEAWRPFARDQGFSARSASVGASFLAACEAATGSGARDAWATGEGLREVLAGHRGQFTREYDSPSLPESRVRLSVSQVRSAGEAAALVAYLPLPAGVPSAESAPARAVRQTASLREPRQLPMWVFDPDSLRFLLVNEAAVAAYGYSREQFLAMALPDIGAVMEAASPRDPGTPEPGDPYGGPAIHRRRDGQPLEVRIESQPILYAGRPARLATAEVLSDNPPPRSEATPSDEQYLALVESIEEVVWEMDLQTRQCTFVSRKAEQVLGYPVADWLGEPDFWINHVHQSDRDDVVAACRRANEQGGHYTQEYRFLAAEGRQVWIRGVLTMTPANGHGARLRGTMLDITRSRETEAAQRAAEARYRGIAETASEGIWTADAAGRIEFVNHHLARMLGFAETDLVGQSVGELSLWGEDADWIRELQEGRQRGPREVQLVRKDGTLLWATVSTAPIQDEAGNLIGSVGMATDASARRQAEEASYSQYALMSAIVEGTADAIYVKDVEGCYLLVNRAMARLDADLLAPEIAGPLQEHDRQVLASGADLVVEEIVGAGGERRALFVTKTAWRGPAGGIMGVIGIATDITARKAREAERGRSEEQQRQAQKMEAIGQLASGVAHDFNNLLTTILGSVQLVLSDLAPGHRYREELEEIEKSGNRAAALTRQLLAFSRSQEIEPRRLDLNATLRGLSGLLRRLIGETIAVVTHEEPALGDILADPVQIEQIVMNLAVNARDAMPGGGALHFDTANVTLDADYAARHLDVAPGEYVMLAVSDTGAGMDAETRQRIFEPFFTTKSPGRGTGLGLATVYGIVRQSKGTIWVYSEPGVGTTFKVFFPRVRERAGAPAAEGGDLDLPQGTETILVVDDEASLRRVTRRLLTRLGYDVLLAAGPAEAVRIVETHPGPIHLVLSDLVLPEASGIELVRRLSALEPALRAVYTSGYSGSASQQLTGLPATAHFLAKPYSMRDLAETVRRALDGVA
jgi:PAS domain S-box-containing protein